jgi:hypothetical protein
MSGYRQSSFDPNAGGAYGRPLRPFNRWQWIGVGLVVAGIAVMIAVMAGSFGLVPKSAEDILPMGTSLSLIGALLVNSRREMLSPEETAAQRRKNLMGAVVGLAVSLILLAAILISKGA